MTRKEMTDVETDECGHAVIGVIRPTFLPLASKKTTFCPTLPGTPEQGGLYDTMVVIQDRDVTQWGMFTSSDYDVNERSYYGNGDCQPDVFTPQKEIPTSLCNEKREITQQPQCEDLARKKMKQFCPQWGSKNDDKENQCCSQWLRNYISKLWVKAPVDPLPEVPQKPKQLTILERELTFKQISPKHLRKFSKKQRHGATSQFIYSAFLGIEDTIVELKEERHEDVIYSITIKKDGSLPRNASTPKLLSEVDVMKEKSTSKQIKGATLDFMVKKLAGVFAGENDDVNFLNVFLTTYRTFTSPEELFDKLHDEYMQLKSESNSKNIVIMKSIVKVLRAWLERYSSDDFQNSDDNKLLRKLLALAKIHDDVINKNDVIYNDKSHRKPPVSPLSPRKNGLVYGNCFSDYVAAKLVVAGKNKKDKEGVCSSLPSPTHSQDPSLNVLEDGSSLNSSPAKMLLNTLSSRYVATQLTVIAAKLFHRVQPHHCLTAAASSKNRPQTVRATIDQFNRVVYCVVGTILCPSLKPSQRTKLLTKWIEVAQECRELKNFSSLRAIVSGLQAYALHRLKRSWIGVLHSHTELLKELGEINMKDLILKVGTAKVNTEDSAISRVRKEATIRREKDNASGIMHGTVPYLGSFLTDLTYLDTARPDFIEEGIINFEKRRKEFELLAQLQLWQASCRCYQNLESEPQFLDWFQSITVLTDDQSCKLSEMIEPQITSPTRKTLPDMSHSDRDLKSPKLKFQGSANRNENSYVKGHKTSQSFNGRIPTPVSTPGSQQGSAVKIRLVRNKTKYMEDDNNDEILVSGCEYKTIFISSDDRNTAVIKKALEAYMIDVETNLKRFSLVQILHDSNKEIQIPDTANVFYAMNKSDDEPTLVLLEQGAQIPQKVKRHQSTPVRPKKKHHRKTHSISYATEPESGRSSPMSNVSSPMKSLYRQIAFGSMALVSGASYSLTEARRASDGDGDEVAGTNGVVLMNSRPGDEVDSKQELHTWRKRLLEMRLSMSGSVKLRGTSQRQTRCYSADFAESVLLSKNSQSSSSLSATHPKLTKSAPCSPHLDRKDNAAVNGPADKVVTVNYASGSIRELPRKPATEYGRSLTWSSRRTIRKPKTTRSMSTFYVNKTSHSSSEEFSVAQSPVTPGSKSRFYVGVGSNPLPVTPDSNIKRATTEMYKRSFSSSTLPSKLGADFSGFDYDVRAPLRDSISLDTSKHGEISLSKFEVSSLHNDSASFASVSSSHSIPEIGGNSDSSSGICFVAASSEDNVFHENQTDVTPHETVPDTDIQNVCLNRSTIAPVIKIHSASPNNLLDENESGFFDRQVGDTSDTDSVASQDNIGENNKEYITYL